jgi:hypothetical protein
MPDQPWTAWWEIDDAEPAAQREHGGETPQDAAATEASVPTTTLTSEPATAQAPTERDPDPYEFPHAEVTGGGGLRRIGVAPPDVPAAPADATPLAAAPAAEPVAEPVNWGLVETAAAGAPATAGVQTIYGRFSVEGVARRPGDLVFTGVTFPDPVSAVPTANAIELSIESATNVALDGVVVADMGGFTPGRQGFTLITTALGAGPVRVDGQYVVEN